MTACFRRKLPALALTCLLSITLGIVTHNPVADAAPAGASAYVPVSPSRVLDTRVALGFGRRVIAGEAFTLTLPGVPAGASAVVLNLTIASSGDAGFVTVYPTGIKRPLASSINVDGAGQTIANLVTVPVGTGGKVDIFSQMATDIVADVQGYYAPASAAQAGRFTAVTPTRLLDTREASSPHRGPLNANESYTLNIAAAAGIPADATAAALNVTVTDSKNSGFWTVFPAGSARPTASNLNVTGAGATIANQVIARLSGGQATIFSQSGGHLVIDVVGWFTGPSAASSDVGLFVPVTPARLIDTRVTQPGASLFRSQTAEVPVAGRFGVPASGVSAVVVNATITSSVGAGYFTIWPARTYRPTASSLNSTYAGQTIANHVIAPVSTTGFEFFTEAGAHLVADVAGWYTGAEVPAVLPPPVPLTSSSGPPAMQPYGFTRTNAAGPLRWNPCQPIPYSINLNGYGADKRQVVREALDRVQAATGLNFVAAPDTTYTPTSNSPTGGIPAGSQLVIALTDEAHTDLIAGSIVGRADISFSSVILRSTVVIDMGDLGSRPYWQSMGFGPVLLHELGHAVGLAHVADASQVMNDVATATGPVSYAAGDLAGLWQVGAIRGCAA